MKEAGLQPEACILKKITQLHECLQVRHGVMLVGPTGSGKTTVLRVGRIIVNGIIIVKILFLFFILYITFLTNTRAIE